MTRVLIGICLALALAAAAGWTLWWARGVQVERARQRAAASERALATCRANTADLQRALDDQAAAVRRLEAAARVTQERLEAAVRAAERRERAAALEAGARAQEAEELRQRLQRLPELQACREAWHWTAEVTDE